MRSNPKVATSGPRKVVTAIAEPRDEKLYEKRILSEKKRKQYQRLKFVFSYA